MIGYQITGYINTEVGGGNDALKEYPQIATGFRYESSSQTFGGDKKQHKSWQRLDYDYQLLVKLVSQGITDKKYI